MAASYRSPTRNTSHRAGPASFNSPITPSTASSASLGKSRHVTSSLGSRKRPRNDGPRYVIETPYSNSARRSHATLETSGTYSSGVESPVPLANSRYRLAGGVDTSVPTTPTDLARSRDLDIDFRRRWDSGDRLQRKGTARSGIDPLSTERNGGRKRAASTSTETGESWGQYVYNMVGGIANKMWNFFGTSAFPGFIAGEGPTLINRPSAGGGEELDTTWVMPSRSSTPMPGQYPESVSPANDSPGVDDLEFRPAKRIHTSRGEGWVMVDQVERDGLVNRSTPSRRSLLPRPTSNRVSSGHRPRSSTARLPGVSMAGSPQLHKRQSASMASPRVVTPSSQAGASPLSAEVQRYAAQREREERQQDAKISKVNQHIKAMIKEGKAALSSKVENMDHEELEESDDDYDEPYEMDRNW